MAKQYLTHGKFYGFNFQDAHADAIEISDGRISRVGMSADLLDLASSQDTITDLAHAFVLPGFTDSHIHLLAYGLSLQRVDAAAESKSACLARVAERSAVTPDGEWIVGHGWDHNIWGDGFGTKDDLDKVSVRHPIYLTHKSLHCGWANSAALHAAGITDGTSDPSGGTIVRADDNAPNGILLENAMRIIESAIPEPSQDQVDAALLAAQHALFRFGITAVHDFDPWNVYHALQRLQSQHQLALRVIKSIPQNTLHHALAQKFKSGDGDDRIKIGWLKLFADGALGPQTAAMLAPYEGSTNFGMLFLDKDEIIAIGQKALSAGIAMAVHAIGDRANRTVLSAFEDLHHQGLLPIPQLPSRIEHVQILTSADFPRFQKLGITASMQPIHAISDMEMADAHWGDRCHNAYAWQSLLDYGANLIFGSDAPVESPNPFLGIAAAISRRKLQDPRSNASTTGWIPNQCVRFPDAINAYCGTPARMSEKRFSSGKDVNALHADLVVLPADFASFSPDEIARTHPSATMVAGNWVYKSDKMDLE